MRKAEESEKLKQERAQLLLNKLYTVAERNKLVQVCVLRYSAHSAKG